MKKITSVFLLLFLTMSCFAWQEYTLVYQGYSYKKTLCDDPTYAPGEKVKLSAGIPEMSGKVFSHWEFEGNKYTPSQTFVMPHKDVVLVPVWEDKGTGIENLQQSAVSSQKVLRDGVLYIIYNGVKYNVMGERVQ